MPKPLIRAIAFGTLMLPLAGCFSYSETPSRPASVVVQQPSAPAPTSTTTTIVRPAY